MKIIELTAENVKRLKAVTITPDGSMQVITGRNKQGKSSVLDSIWLALGGGSAARDTDTPIRDGETTASVTLDLGDLIVTRSWKGEKSTLKVKSKDGSTYSSPQKVLDALVGRLSFDPLAFTHLDASAQREALLSLVELSFDPAAMAAERRQIYEIRTQVSRDVKRAEGMAETAGRYDPNLLDVVESVGSLMDEMRTSEAHNRSITEFMVTGQAHDDYVDSLKRDIEFAVAKLKSAESARDEYLASAAAADLTFIDIDAISMRVDNIQAHREAVNDNAHALAASKEVKRARKEYADLTKSIEKLDAEKTTGLSKAIFPVPGLGFDDDGVTYNGVTFKQASSAEQIYVSVAMAMTLNPKLRVIRIMNGSLLDADAMAALEKMAVDNDFQVWVERVSDGSGVGVTIEDGEVAE